jgi:hypothetical protein
MPPPVKFIRNPDINPIAPLLLNILVLAGSGFMVIGQTKKGITLLLSSLVGICLCCLPGVLMVILSHVDLYMCTAALQRGETLQENEYRLEVLYKIVSLYDKTAVFNS